MVGRGGITATVETGIVPMQWLDLLLHCLLVARASKFHRHEDVP